jgi:hypothetical protein
LAQPGPLASNGSTTVGILLFFDLARLVITVEKLINNPLMTQSSFHTPVEMPN